MPNTSSGTGGRDYVQLLQATSELLAVLSSDGNQETALRASFEAAARGLGARQALLLLVEERDPLRLRCIHTVGDLTAEQVRACEKGASGGGAGGSVIHRVIESGQTELVEDPRLQPGAARRASLAASEYGALCAPILDPLRASVLAVAYFLSGSLVEPYGERDREWLARYAAAVGRVFAFHFSHERRQRERRELPDSQGRAHDAPEIVGDSAHTQALRRALHETFIPSLDAENPEPILILGERGTGKDLVARYVHAYSSRSRKPLVVVNCAEITDELAASRFFGHKRGSFTGAMTDEPGFFRAADRGILFLDEVAELSLRAQAHLLRMLESHTVVPVGQTREVRVDVAVILATNVDEAGRERLLRADFYDRVRTLTIALLPLRERPWDVPLLLDHFRRYHERKQRKRTLGFTLDALRALMTYTWPGNVRELARNCSFLVIHARPGAWIDSQLIDACLPDVRRAGSNPKAGLLLAQSLSMHGAVREFQRELIRSRLQLHGSVKAARESLGLTKTTFHRYVKSLSISAQSEASAHRPAAAAKLLKEGGGFLPGHHGSQDVPPPPVGGLHGQREKARRQAVDRPLAADEIPLAVERAPGPERPQRLSGGSEETHDRRRPGHDQGSDADAHPPRRR